MDIIILILLCFVLEIFVRLLLFVTGFCTVVKEREARVYVLFGNVVGTLTEPGIHFLWFKFGPAALLVNWLGKRYVRNLTLDQEYIRSIPVNSEEGTPMGIGVWYEMFITDPQAHVFKNIDPRGSLSAHVKNATINSLSNLPMDEMLINRHPMSKSVREEVSPESNEWGYKLGSVYIRKVHFRDAQMIRQIEEKVVNRLRQVTSAIKQEGANQVNVIKSKADREAAIEFAKATAVRPWIIGETLREVGKDSEVLSALLDLLEYKKILESKTDLTVIPAGGRADMLTQLLVTNPPVPSVVAPPAASRKEIAKIIPPPKNGKKAS